MKIKPILIDHFECSNKSFIIDFYFKNNITILFSGMGKTTAFSVIKEKMESNIICLNYLDYQKDILKIIKKARGKLIVIDNADVLLNDETRKYISLDGENQYLIIGRNPKNLFATKENLFELVSEKVGEQTRFSIREYM